MKSLIVLFICIGIFIANTKIAMPNGIIWLTMLVFTIALILSIMNGVELITGKKQY